MFGLDLPGVLAGPFITQTILNQPGSGPVRHHVDLPQRLPVGDGVTIFGAFFSAIADLCIDIVYAYVDPRVRFA
jgi:peptide/nickel transport system permease protein